MRLACDWAVGRNLAGKIAPTSSPFLEWLGEQQGCQFMSNSVREILTQHRPRGFTGRGDRYLADVAQRLRRVLVRNQQTLTYPTCRLSEHHLSQLAVLLVEFAEDVHSDIGLWRTTRARELIARHHARFVRVG